MPERAPTTAASAAPTTPERTATDAHQSGPNGLADATDEGARPSPADEADGLSSADAVPEGRAPALGTDDIDEGFIHRIAPVFKLLRLYSRLEVEGLERLPDGPVILIANHTGWLGLDYAYTALSIYDAKKRIVRGMAHRTWFLRPRIGDIAHRLGLTEVSKDAMRRTLEGGHMVLIFPEGEKGAFKPERERYLLQDFARGYIRTALECGVPIVPVAIVGGEEANPSSARLDSYEDLLNLSLPMPQNLFPRPVKWRISFLPAVRLDGGPEKASDHDYVHEWNDRIRTRLQAEIARLVSVRGNPFL